MTVIITAYHYEDSGVQIRFLVYAINGKELDGYPSLDFKTVQYPHDEWERFLEFVLENETFREDFRLVMLEQSTLLSSWKRSRRTDTFFNWSDDQEPDTKKRKASDEQEPATKKPKASVTGTAEQAASEQPAEEATAILAEQATKEATEEATKEANKEATKEATECEHCGKVGKSNSDGWQSLLDGGWSNDDILLCDVCTDTFQRCCIVCGEKYSALCDDDDFSIQTEWQQCDDGYWTCTNCQ